MSGRSRLLVHGLSQAAVHWGTPTNDGYGGRAFASTTDILVRWEDKHELFKDSQGREVVSRAVVFVDRDIPVGDFLMLGTVAGLTPGAAQPSDNAEAFEVRSFTKIPDLMGTRFTRKAWL